MSKFEEFLDEINTLPIEIRRSLVLMRELDTKKDELQNTNNRIAKQYFASISKKKAKTKNNSGQGQANTDEKKIIEQIRKNYDQIQRLSKEKIDLAKKVFSYVESNLAKVNRKMTQLEEKIKKSTQESTKQQTSSKGGKPKQWKQDEPSDEDQADNDEDKCQKQSVRKSRYSNLRQNRDDAQTLRLNPRSKQIIKTRRKNEVVYEESKKGGIVSDQEEDKGSEKNEDEEEMIITTSLKKKQKNRKRGLSFEDQEGLIEPVPYEANQELLRAFGQPVGTKGATVGGKHSQAENKSMIREPTYCFCNNVSYGDMIACDNKDCKYEWFHFPCVGLTAKPEGKWYCQKCLTNFSNISGGEQEGILKKQVSMERRIQIKKSKKLKR